jgi:Tfp pilus assembly protein PilE
LVVMVNSNKGMTLVEILTIIVIVVVLTIAANSVRKGYKFRKNGGARAWVVSVATEILEIKYKIDKRDK